MAPRAFWFIVGPDTWPEHWQAGVAAINDPHFEPTSQSWAQRQSAIAEMSGIRPGDLIFFYMRFDLSFLGVFEATTSSYFDTNLLFIGATHVGANLPFRVGFRQKVNYPCPLQMNDIWAVRDQGLIWTVQQSRGDAVARHACNGLIRPDVHTITRMFAERNITDAPVAPAPPLPATTPPLPIDLTAYGGGRLHYEAALEALLLEDLADGYHKQILGNYDDFVGFTPTSERMEMDVLLLKYDTNDDVIWFHVLELKQDSFTIRQLRRLIDYESWLIRVPARGNKRAVYPSALAYKFDSEVREFVRRRQDYGEKPIRLIAYELSGAPPPRLDLQEVVP